MFDGKSATISEQALSRHRHPQTFPQDCSKEELRANWLREWTQISSGNRRSEFWYHPLSSRRTKTRSCLFRTAPCISPR